MIPEHAITVEAEVPFYECDPLFVVWHGRYFEYFSRARMALLKTFDLDVPTIRALGYRMYVTEVRCRYSHPLAYGDRVAVTAWLTDARPLLRFAFDVRNLTQGRRAARATVTIATTDAEGALLPETPDPIFERLPVS